MRMGFWGLKMALPSSSSSPIVITTLLMMSCFIIRVSSNENSSAHTLGYEHVATVYLGQTTGNWAAPCFLQNSARIQTHVVPGTFVTSVTITPHYGKCWTCRDDYQIKLGDQIMATGSTYFGNVENSFLFYLQDKDQRKKVKKEGMQIFVDMNAACNGVSRKIMKNPFGDMEFIATN